MVVTGVDISDVQIERARRLVPRATFVRADATTVEFAPGSCDAVVTLFALIHIPLAEQPLLLTRIGSWLRPGGWLLATAGARRATVGTPSSGRGTHGEPGAAVAKVQPAR
jgi:SAM-dependent methyltransferase